MFSMDSPPAEHRPCNRPTALMVIHDQDCKQLVLHG